MKFEPAFDIILLLGEEDPSYVADPGCLMFIPDPDFVSSRIQEQQSKT
jgi:hypothetical protein